MTSSSQGRNLARHAQGEKPVSPAERLEAIDMLRGIALFGVLMVNLIFEFRVSLFQQFIQSSEALSASDLFIGAFVHEVLEMKAFAIFSLLFGIGLGIQFERFSEHGLPTYRLARRLLVLLVFGLVHIVFLWNGDILTEYALAGLLVLPLMREHQATLAIVAATLFGIYMAEPFLHLRISLPPPEAMQRHVQAATTMYGHGGWFDIWLFSLSELKILAPLLIWVFPRTLGFLFLGVILWRSKIIQQLPSKKAALGKAGLALFAAGALLEVIAESGFFSDQLAMGNAVDILSPILLALGYTALFGYAVQIPSLRKVFALFGPLGRMAFSNYIAQSLILSLIFYGYGFGLFGRTRVTTAFAIGLSIYVVQMIASALWLRHFRFGPLEWMWRTLTYGTTQAMRRTGQ